MIKGFVSQMPRTIAGPRIKKSLIRSTILMHIFFWYRQKNNRETGRGYYELKINDTILHQHHGKL